MVSLKAWLAAAAAACACACAPVQVEVRHALPPVIEYAGPRPGIGILAIDGTDATGSAMIFDAIKSYFIDEAANLTIVDYRSVGYVPRWNVNPPALPPVPDAVQSPLCAVVRVVDWRFDPGRAPGGNSHDTARVSLEITTFLHDGQLLQHAVTSASATSGFYGVVVSSDPPSERLLAEYQAAYPNNALMTDGQQMTAAVLRAAVSYYFFEFVPHTSREKFVVDDSGEYLDGVVLLQQGKYDAAVEAFTRITHDDPDAAGAWYDLGVAWLARGDLEQAAAALKRSLAVKRTAMAEELFDEVKDRLSRRRVLH